MVENGIKKEDDLTSGGTDVIPQAKRIPDKLFQEIQGNVPIPCVDLVVIRRMETDPEILLIKRDIQPEKGKWCLIGGRVLKDERLGEAIDRQAKHELGVQVKILEGFDETRPFVFDAPDADPQKHSIAHVYPVEIVKGELMSKGPESDEIRWIPVNKLPTKMGFNHREVINTVISELKL